MLPKEKRLNLSKEFKWVAQGTKVSTQNFKLFYRFADNPHPRMGIALSSEYFKKSHDRNRARRITSKALEAIYSSLPKGLNLVIMPKAVVLEKSAGDLESELKDSIASLQNDR